MKRSRLRCDMASPTNSPAPSKPFAAWYRSCGQHISAGLGRLLRDVKFYELPVISRSPPYTLSAVLNMLLEAVVRLEENLLYSVAHRKVL